MSPHKHNTIYFFICISVLLHRLSPLCSRATICPPITHREAAPQLAYLSYESIPIAFEWKLTIRIHSLWR